MFDQLFFQAFTGALQIFSYSPCYEPSLTRKQISQNKQQARFINKRKNEYNLDKLLYKQISTNLFQSKEKVPH